jgi:outer membrane protein assembly factor BamB
MKIKDKGQRIKDKAGEGTFSLALLCVLRVSAVSISVFALSCSGALYFSDSGTEEADAGWEQYGGSGARTGYAPRGVDPPLKLRARMKVGSAIMASPLVRGGVVYAVGVDGRGRAWDREVGASLGKWRSKGRVLETPAFWNGLLVLPKCGKKEELAALDIFSGKVRWRLKGASAASPLVSGDRLFVTTESGAVIGLNAADGTERWRSEMEGATFSLSKGDTTLYVGTDEGVVALGESCGALLWKRETAGGIRATPAVGEHGVYVGSTDGVVYRLDRASGEVIWIFELEAGIYGGCALDSERVYFGATDRALYALDRSTGQLVWRFETKGVIRAAPVTTGRTVYVGSMDRFFYGVAPDSGALLWKYETKGAIISAPALVGDGVYVGSTDGFLYAFERK